MIRPLKPSALENAHDRHPTTSARLLWRDRAKAFPFLVAIRRCYSLSPIGYRPTRLSQFTDFLPE
jgi:hypothetical protein